jgi:hypothetical protein
MITENCKGKTLKSQKLKIYPDYDYKYVSPDSDEILPVNFGTEHKAMLSLLYLMINKGYLVFQKNAKTGRYFVSYLVLTSPKKQNDEINIWFTRSYGKISFGGSAKILVGEITFSIRSISDIGVVPMIAEGSITDKSFELKAARFSPSIPISNHPTKET